ncbi:transposase [Deinococcus sp. QL22]|uniref:transposase n=1 Tax=Deinococcus sp. QL22 TaxID=2939437 RepID=UPI0035303EB3
MTTTQPHQDQIDDQHTLGEVSDELWIRLAPVLVIEKPRKKSGRPAWDARSMFNGMIWLARTGHQWSQLSRRYGPTSTVHERLSGTRMLLCGVGHRTRRVRPGDRD